MAAGNDLNQRLGDAYHAALRDGTLPAIGREAIKDVRSTLMEVFFGRGERGGEPGSPLNPLFHDLVQARNGHAPSTGMETPMNGNTSPSQLIDTPNAYRAELTSPQADLGADRDQSQDRGSDYGDGNQPSPSQIADDPQAHLTGQDHDGPQHSHEQDLDHGMSM